MKLTTWKMTASIVMALIVCLYIPFSVFATFTNPTTTNSNYDRGDAYDYMTSYTKNYNTAYYYFPADCTNFVSQILQEGGMSFTSRSTNPDYTYWYYYTSDWGWGRTATWTGAYEFSQHWADVNGVGFKRAYRFTQYTVNSAITNFDTIYDDVWEGDIIQMVHNSDGHAYHSEAVYSFPLGGIKMAEHSGSNGDDFYDLLSELQVDQNLGLGTDKVNVIQIKYGS